MCVCVRGGVGGASTKREDGKATATVQRFSAAEKNGGRGELERGGGGGEGKEQGSEGAKKAMDECATKKGGLACGRS